MIKVLLPAFNAPIDPDGDVTLLAHGAAEAARLFARSNMCQRVGKVVELAAGEELGRHVALEPENLGHLHLDVHGAADVAQEVVARGVDGIGLGLGSVVEPQDYIAVVGIGLKVGARDGYGLVGIVGEDAEGARGVEAEALDGGRVDLGLGKDTAHTAADAVPDVGRGLFLKDEGTWIRSWTEGRGIREP